MTPETLAVIVCIVLFVGLAFVWAAQYRGRAQEDEPDTAEFAELVGPSREAELWPWPEWPVTREKGDRVPRARRYERSR